MTEKIPDNILYSMIGFLVSFFLFLLYYFSFKPEYVLYYDDTQKTKKVSFRLSIIYSLLFSSFIGILILIVYYLYLYYKNYNYNNNKNRK